MSIDTGREFRRMLLEAFENGYYRGTRGETRELCPYPQGAATQQIWLLAWEAGFDDSMCQEFD